MASGTIIDQAKLTKYSLLNEFRNNGDTWTAPSDGFINFKTDEAIAGLCYVYLLKGSSPLATIVCKDGTGGLTYSAFCPIEKGGTYSLLISGFSRALCEFFAL